MVTGTITVNDKTTAGREFLQQITSMPEVKFKITKTSEKAKTEAEKKRKKKEKFLKELVDAMIEAEEMVKSGKKGYTAEEFKKLL